MSVRARCLRVIVALILLELLSFVMIARPWLSGRENRIGSSMLENDLLAERPVHIITLNASSPRALKTKKVLQRMGFKKFFMELPEPIRKRGTVGKIRSNKDTFLRILRAFVADSRDAWTYIFEDDVAVHGNPTVSDFHAVDRASDLFYYMGICLQHDPPANPQGDCGRCAHAMAFSQAGARDFLAFSENDTLPFVKGRTPKQEPFMDVTVHFWCNQKNQTFLVLWGDTCLTQTSHCGMFYQDRNAFPSQMGRYDKTV